MSTYINSIDTSHFVTISNVYFRGVPAHDHEANNVSHALLYIPRYIRDGGFFWSFIKTQDNTWYIQHEKDKTYMAPDAKNKVIVLIKEPFSWNVEELPGGFFQISCTIENVIQYITSGREFVPDHPDHVYMTLEKEYDRNIHDEVNRQRWMIKKVFP